MSIFGAHLEPYTRDGEIWVMTIQDGLVDHISPSEFWNKDRFTPVEQRMLEGISAASRWKLPRRIDLQDERPELKEIHGNIVRYLHKYVWFSDEDHYDVVANWVIGTYFRDQFNFSPFLIFDGITSTGKTTALKALEKIVYRGYITNNNSAAAIARDIEDYDVTVLMDEAVDNLSSERGNDLCALIKSMWEPTKWIRADPKGRRNFVYNTYTNVALAVKGVGLPEDIYNRGIRIGMAGMPDETTLEDIYSCEEDDIHGPASPGEIRNALYAMKMATIQDPMGERSVSFAGAIRTTRQHVTERCENGQWLYAYILDLPENSPQIKNRNRNIASTLYSLGIETQSELPTVRAILKNDEANREVMADTEETLIFVAFLEIVKAEAAGSGLAFDTPMDAEQFQRIVRGISTTDIALGYNDLLTDIGNAGRDPVSTKTVTAKLNALGLQYRRGAHNRSWMDPCDTQFARTFLKYVRAYSPQDLGRFSGISG